jgi:hypothetical protein
MEKNTHPVPVSVRIGYGCHPQVKDRPGTRPIPELPSLLRSSSHAQHCLLLQDLGHRVKALLLSPILPLAVFAVCKDWFSDVRVCQGLALVAILVQNLSSLWPIW